MTQELTKARFGRPAIRVTAVVIGLWLALPVMAQSGGDFGGSFEDPAAATQPAAPPPPPPAPTGGADVAAAAQGGDFGGSFGDGVATPVADPATPAPPPPPPPPPTPPPPAPPPTAGVAQPGIGGGDFGDGGSFDPGAGGGGVAPQAPAPAPQPQPQAQTPGPTIDPQIAAFELRDFGVPPVSTLRAGQFHAPTPTAVPGAQTVTTEGLAAAMSQGMQLVLIDVLGGDYSLPNALVVPELANPGNLNDRIQQQATQWLGQVTQGKTDAPVVIYCSGPECWLSYNAVLRTVAAGYTNVYWYRGGLEAWQMAGLQLSPASF